MRRHVLAHTLGRLIDRNREHHELHPIAKLFLGGG
jgi:hypothetical protein